MHIFSTKTLLDIRQRCEQVYIDQRVKEYILRLVMATRHDGELEAQEAKPDRLAELRKSIHIGASPRATIFLTRAAKANALVEQRAYVTPDDVKAVAPEVMRHRLILTFEAEARGLSTDDVIQMLLESVVVP